MKKKLIVAVALAAAPMGAAYAMDVATFLTKADALEKKGMLALLSSDLTLLKTEVQNAATALRAERIAAEKAGRKRTYCNTGNVALSEKDILAAMRAVPPARRRSTQVKDALRTYMVRRFPCR
jgi:hypothetical protein